MLKTDNLAHNISFDFQVELIINCLLLCDNWRHCQINFDDYWLILFTAVLPCLCKPHSSFEGLDPVKQTNPNSPTLWPHVPNLWCLIHPQDPPNMAVCSFIHSFTSQRPSERKHRLWPSDYEALHVSSSLIGCGFHKHCAANDYRPSFTSVVCH